MPYLYEGSISHLSLSRSFGELTIDQEHGNRQIKVPGISAEPTIVTTIIDPQPGKTNTIYVVVASDGIWDAMTNERAAYIVTHPEEFTGGALSQLYSSYYQNRTINQSLYNNPRRKEKEERRKKKKGPGPFF
ncbi:MAG: hypothetical protein HQK53_05360 [Oligoflexia bacterium]|nr:hypothetical protein [Oligoflexia bacterium]